jgi:EpsI family protein
MEVKSRLRNGILLAAMVAASGLALGLKPTVKVADAGPKINLESMVPHRFGEWQQARFGSTQIVDPQQQATIDKIYNQTLSRSYVNSRGYVIMLSLAYGSDQSDSLQLHRPEVCYPAQGFQLLDKRSGILEFPSSKVPAMRLRTVLGPRQEPVTYWTTVGNKVVLGRLQKKLAEMSFGLNRKIPDGMLVRVSSIDTDSERAFVLQAQFAVEMVGAMAVEHRQRFVGLPE